MSTVMGRVNKEPIRLVIILANELVLKNYDFMCMLTKYVDWVGKKLAELFLSVREDFEFRGFEVVFHTATLKTFRKTLSSLESNRPDIFLNFFVGRFSHFVSCHKGFLNYFLIPERFMKTLPTSLENEDDWSNKTRNNFSELMSHMIHETCHALGGFNADHGIMGRHFDLLAEDNTHLRDIKFSDFVDAKTLNIICESMSIITTLRPERDLKYIDGHLTYNTDQSIAAVFFVKENRYLNPFEEFTYLDATKSYSARVPEGWDGFVVVHFCGHIFHYTKQDVTTTRRCSKVTEF